MEKIIEFRDGNYTYILKVNEKNKKYSLIFKDYDKHEHEIEINHDVYLIFDKSRLQDKRQKNEYSRHIEHYNPNGNDYDSKYENDYIDEIEDKSVNVEKEAIRNCMAEEVRNALDELPEIQKRRIKKYFFENKTYEQIAQEEKCTKRAVKCSVDIAIKEIYKKITN